MINPIDLIEESLSDFLLSKAEKKEIKAALMPILNSEHEANVLRSQIFDIALKKSSPDNYYAIIQWIEEMNKIILHSTKKKETDIKESTYFSPGQDCLNAILNQINLSKRTIYCCVFTISDNRITEALVSAKNRGCTVKVITDNDKMFDKGSDIELLEESGIDVKIDRTESHMHHKFAVFDKKWTLTGSYNWTRSAEQYNHENILITNSEDIASQFTREFDKLWHEMEWLN